MKRTAVVPFACLCLVSIAASACGQDPSSSAPTEMTFVAAGSYGNAPTFQVALGDLDGDSDLDAVFANMHAESEVWLNDGGGHFTNSSQRLGSEAHGVGIADLDGDGDLDLLVVRASSSLPSSVYLNDGSGQFTPADGNLGDLSEAANFVHLFDLEGDGDLDAGVYYSSRYNVLYVNDGTGGFEATGARIPGMASWGDLDGDGDVDAVVQRFEGGYQTLLNVGNGAFDEGGLVEAPSSFVPGNTALGDVDNDGDLDLVGANGGAEPDTPLTILRNDGTGRLTHVSEVQFETGFGRVTLGDLNSDGFPDVFIGWLELPGPIALNDGTGGFFDSGTRIEIGDLAGASAVGDLDGDGDLDIFVARYGQGGPNTVWLNQSR
jgi:hypothetical protein